MIFTVSLKKRMFYSVCIYIYIYYIIKILIIEYRFSTICFFSGPVVR